MKMNNATIINVLNTLGTFNDKKLPQKINYAISRNYIYLNNEYKIYQESLEKLMKSYEEYFEKDENGNPKTLQNGFPIVTPPHDGELNEELAELLSMEVDVKRYTIPEDAFDYDDNNGRFDTLSPSEINVLIKILCEDEE